MIFALNAVLLVILMIFKIFKYDIQMRPLYWISVNGPYNFMYCRKAKPSKQIFSFLQIQSVYICLFLFFLSLFSHMIPSIVFLQNRKQSKLLILARKNIKCMQLHQDGFLTSTSHTQSTFTHIRPACPARQVFNLLFRLAQKAAASTSSNYLENTGSIRKLTQASFQLIVYEVFHNTLTIHDIRHQIDDSIYRLSNARCYKLCKCSKPTKIIGSKQHINVIRLTL